MITHSPLTAHDLWDKKSPVDIYGCGFPGPEGTLSNKNDGIPQKRGVRNGSTRKVSALSAEQLDRKRANDREAQRSIRQKTKQYMKQLETQVKELQMQVAELRPRSDRYEDLIKRNASLEDEVIRSKHQLSAFTGHSALPTGGDQAGSHRTRWAVDESLDSTPSSMAMLPTHFPVSPYSPSGVPRAASVMSASMQSSHSHDWQRPYSNTQSPSLGNCSDTEFSAPVDPYLLESQIHQSSHVMPSSFYLPNSQLDFNNTVSSTHPSDSSLCSIYSVGQHQGQLPEDQLGQFLPAQGSISTSTSYPPLHQTIAPLPSQRSPSYPCAWAVQT